MRLELLQLSAYGPFTACNVALHSGMNVIYGPNEAGKSSALRAIRSLLFGFDHKTADDFIHSYPQLRVGGILVDSKGNRLECVRRKGRTTTLRDGADDKPVDETLLQAMLGGVSEEFFATVFGIDHLRLREGGQDVVRGQGRIGELLFAAGGVTHLRAKQIALEATAGSLYKPSGRNPRINAALSQIKQLNDEIRDLQRSPEEWERHDAELRQAAELERSLKAKLADSESNKSRLSRIQSAIGLLASWKQKQGELGALAHVASLPADALERFQGARDKENLAANSQAKATEQIEFLQGRLNSVEVPAGVIANAMKIDDLYRRLGSHEKAVADRAVLEGQQRTARNNAKRSLEKLGWELKLDEAGARRLPDDKKARVRALANQHGQAMQRSALQQQRVERLRRQIEACTAKQLGLPTLTSTPSLKEAFVAAAASMDSYRRFEERRLTVGRLQGAANDALTRLPFCRGSLDEIRLLKVPGVETVDIFEESLREIQGAAKRLLDQRSSCQADAQRIRRELEASERAESVPTEEDLAAVRAVRDRGVHIAVRSLSGRELDPDAIAAFVKDVAEGADVASALEPSVRNADALADRLRRESARVAQKSSSLAQLHSLEEKVGAIDREAAEVDARQARWQSEWNQAWKETSIIPATPSEMRGWLRKYAELLALINELAAATNSLAAEETTLAAIHARLSVELVSCRIQVPHGAAPDSLLALAKERVDGAESLQHERRSLAVEIARLEEEATDAAREAEIAQADLIAWQENWTAALLPLQLDGSALPDQAEAVLTNLDELFRDLDCIDGLKARIWGIDKTAQEFAQAAVGLTSAIASDLSALPVEQMVATLNARLTSAKQAQQLTKSLEEQLLAVRQKLREAESDLAASRVALNALFREAACDSQAELRVAIANSQTKAALQSNIKDLEEQLLPFCAGKTLDEFNADAESEDADRLKPAIDELDSEIAALRDQRDGAIKAVERLTGILNQFAGAAAAAEKAIERQFLVRQLEDDAREYAVTAVASRLLQRAVERYREKSQGPVLAEASKYFAKLTCRTFKGLRSDYDDSGQEVLVGIRDSGAPLRVEAMSEGTQDQLYLALRLGTLEHWFDRHEPIPFVVDDVLLTFDDERASAALEALLELSKRTQVLFFTHHAHLASLARDVAKSTGNESQCNVVSDWNRSASA